jgi:hypothetical protein
VRTGNAQALKTVKGNMACCERQNPDAGVFDLGRQSWRRVSCFWNDGPGGAQIPALEEARRFLPEWVAISKAAGGLVEAADFLYEQNDTVLREDRRFIVARMDYLINFNAAFGRLWAVLPFVWGLDFPFS